MNVGPGARLPGLDFLPVYHLRKCPKGHMLLGEQWPHVQLSSLCRYSESKFPLRPQDRGLCPHSSLRLAASTKGHKEEEMPSLGSLKAGSKKNSLLNELTLQKTKTGRDWDPGPVRIL